MIEAMVLGVVVVAQLGVIIVLLNRLLGPKVSDEDPSTTLMDELKSLLPLPSKADPNTSPMPQDVVDYCEKWLDDFAKDSCKMRARRHYAQERDWDVVLTTLAREDGEIL